MNENKRWAIIWTAILALNLVAALLNLYINELLNDIMAAANIAASILIVCLLCRNYKQCKKQ